MFLSLREHKKTIFKCMKNDFRPKCNKENHFTDLLNTLSVQGIHIVVSFDFLSSLLEFFILNLSFKLENFI